MNLKTADSVGYVPDVTLVGKRYKHWKNGKTYVVLRFQFDSERDRWVIVHKCFEDATYENPNPVEFNRTPANMFEMLNTEPGATGLIEPRFLLVS